MKYQAYFSGACEPNPGTMVTAYGITDEYGTVITEIAATCGHGTNNEAEYLALRLLLREVIRLKLNPVEIYGSSKLVVNQILGSWDCTYDHLRELSDECRALLFQCGNVTLQWIPQAENESAVRLIRAKLRRNGIHPRWRCGHRSEAA
jgi:ribonuclease HI